MLDEDTLISQSIISESERFDKQYPNNPRRVLLVGGGGYIGLCIANFLAAEDIEVLIIDNFIYDHGKTILSSLLNKNIKFMHHDLRSGIKENFFQENNLTDLVILAGLVGDPITKKYPELSTEINNISIKNFIESANGQGLNKVIFVSTCSNYGLIADGDKADENFPLNPLSLYAEDKVSNEEYLISNKNKFDFSATILRFATAFGASPRMRFDLTVNEFIHDAFTKKSLEVYDPDTWRPYCHVRDFASLIHRVLSMERKKTHFEIFNAGGDSNNLTKRNIVDMIAGYIPDLETKYVAGGTDPRNYIVDFTKVKTLLYFEPGWSVDDGIKEIIGFLQNGLYKDIENDRNFYGNYHISNGG